VHLVADRLGSRPIYHARVGPEFAWAHEIKAFIDLADFRTNISEAAAEEFLAHGYFSHNRTWFDDVRRLPSSMVGTFDLRTQRFSETRYWAWDAIRPMSEAVDPDEVAEELACRLRAAVGARVGDAVRVGVTLSGGLDSRVILASIPPEALSRTVAYTFGKRGCDEVATARRAGFAATVDHLVFELNASNWIKPRTRGVWVSDGMLDLLHMHGFEFYGSFRQRADVVLNGILGGGLIGGLLARDPTTTEIEILEQRIAGRSIIGVTLESFMIDQRMPFFDNALNEYIFSIPASLKRDAKIYHRMLLTHYPRFFANIPDANTGCPIGAPAWQRSTRTLMRRVSRGAYRVAPFIGPAPRSMMHDYRRWIAREPARNLFNNVLRSKTALFPAYTSAETAHQMLGSHLSGRRDNSAYLCRLLTFELWLQQIHTGSFRGSGPV
jgi:asparagine synthase (glutamine-hydrolysing)